MQLSEKEIVQMEIRSIVDQFYTNKNLNGNNGLSFFIQSYLSSTCLQ